MLGTVNGAQILDSGAIVNYGLQPLAIAPLPPPHNTYVIEVTFDAGSPLMPVNISTEVVDPSHFRVKVSNVNLGVFATSSPLYVANHNGQKVMMSFMVLTVGGDLNTLTKTFCYTMFYGGPINAPA